MMLKKKLPLLGLVLLSVITTFVVANYTIKKRQELRSKASETNNLACNSLSRLWEQWCVYTYDDDIPDKIIHGVDNVYHPTVWRENNQIHMLVGGWKDSISQGYHDQIFHYISDDYDSGISGWNLYQAPDPYIGNDWDIPQAHHTVQPSILVGQNPDGSPGSKTIYYSWDPLGEFPENQVTINNASINAGGELAHGTTNPSVNYGNTVPECGNETIQAVSNGHPFTDPASGKIFLYYNSWLNPEQSVCEDAITSVAQADQPNQQFVPQVYDLLGEGQFGGSPMMVNGPDGRYYLFFDKWFGPDKAEIHLRVSDSPTGPFLQSSETTVLKVPSSQPSGIASIVTAYVFCNQTINRWQMYFAGNTAETYDYQIYTAFSPEGVTCDDPPLFSPPSSPTPETIDTLDYFLSDHPEITLGAPTGGLTQHIVQNYSYYVKTFNPSDIYEIHTWDDNYIYLKRDRNPDNKTYTLEPGIWMKRQMQVGETIDMTQNSSLSFFDLTCTTQGTFPHPYRITLKEHIPNFELGGDLGTQDVIVLTYGLDEFVEYFYYTKEWGWVRWEQRNSQTGEITSGPVIWNQKHPDLKLNPNLQTSCFNAPIPLATTTSVKDFGAKGDGVTDDAPAIQAAIDSLPNSGGTIYLPPGTYMLGTSAGGVENFPDGSLIQSALIINKDNVTITGESSQSILKLMPHTKMRVISITSNNVVIEKITVDGNKANRNGTVPWPNGDVVDGLVYGSSTSSNVTIRSCEVRNGIEDGIGFWQSPNSFVHDCSSHDNGTVQAGGAGLSISGPNNIGARAINNTFTNNTAAGIWLAFGSSDITLDGNLVENNLGAGITTGGDSPASTTLSTNIIITNNTVSENGSTGFPGISIYSAQNGSINNNAITDNFFDGLQFNDQGSIPSSNWAVANNHCSNTTPDRNQDFGIRVLGLSSNITLQGNECVDNGTMLYHQIIVDNESAVNSDWRNINTISYTPAISTSPTPSPTPCTGSACPTSSTPGPTAQPTLTGDINADNHVDILDYTLLFEHFGQEPPIDTRTDINQDGKVNILDYTLLFENFGAGAI